MFQVKFLIVSFLAVGLKEIDGKILTCAAYYTSSYSFDNQVLGINDTANIALSSRLTPASIQYVYFNSFVAKSVSFYYIPASLFTFFPNVN
jgi:hypothetical protein